MNNAPLQPDTHTAPKTPRTPRTMRAVALMEALKGLIVLGGGFGLLGLLHHDVRHIAVSLVTRLHMDPERHYAGVFIDAASRVTDARIWGLAALALTYSTLRFTEGYGLWHARRWALWLGAGGGAIYMPVEIYELWRRPHLISAGTLLLNVAIVAYLLWNLKRQHATAR